MRKPTIKSRMILAFILPLITGIILFAEAAGLTYAYTVTKKTIFGILAIVLSAILLSAILVLEIVFLINQYRVYYNGLYRKTKDNIENLKNNIARIDEFPSSLAREFGELNDDLNVLKHELSNATLIYSRNNYKFIPFNYINDDVIDEESFKSLLDNVINLSFNFKNLILELYYELPKDQDLTAEDDEKIVLTLKNAFDAYQDILIIKKDDNRSYYVYFPRVDNISKIKEISVGLSHNITLIRHAFNGLTNYQAMFAAVCYPYSNVNELFADLDYAKRQKEVISFYLPQRMTSFDNAKFNNSSIYLNNMSKMLSMTSNMTINLEKEYVHNDEINDMLKEINRFLGIYSSGIILFDDNISSYKVIVNQCAERNNSFKVGTIIDPLFVNALVDNADEDKSFYASERRTALNALGRYFDKYNIESTLYYIIKDGSETYGIIYFYNKDAKMKFDSYIQESLLMIATRISAYYLAIKRKSEVFSAKEKTDYILMLNDYSTYTIDRKDYHIIDHSSDLVRIFPDVKKNLPCYKALYGLNKRCGNCPLATSEKKLDNINGSRYETSLTLNSKSSKDCMLLIKKLGKNDEHGDRYNKDLLINSYQSLVEMMRNYYFINSKGYLLLLRIDNVTEFIDAIGSENYMRVVRTFISKIKALGEDIENVYFYNNQVIAILYNEMGQNDVIDKIEKLYGISKTPYYNENPNLTFNITYIPLSYPRGIPSANDFMISTDRIYSNNKFKRNIDYIYFVDSDYSRSASRKDFILSVIEDQFGEKQTFKVSLQPSIDCAKKNIVSAELFIRIEDPFRKILLYPDEVARIAAENNKIVLMSDSLLQYVASLYKNYGQRIFKAYKFNRISINTDYSYFSSPELIKNIKAILDKNGVPTSFVNFEITEFDISKHLDEYKNVSRLLNTMGIKLICDNYTGKYVSLEKLKGLGINEIKISRNLVGYIDSDVDKENELRSLVQLAKTYGIKASLIGVETDAQYKIIKDISTDVEIQGFYFYTPNDDVALINAIRDANRNINRE